MLSNEVNITPEGGIGLRRGNSKVSISVTHSGIGIEDGKMVRISKKFYQLNNAHLDKTPGTGLNFAKAKRLVEAYDVSISVNSKPGSGSTLTIDLLAK